MLNSCVLCRAGWVEEFIASHPPAAHHLLPGTAVLSSASDAASVSPLCATGGQNDASYPGI